MIWSISRSDFVVVFNSFLMWSRNTLEKTGAEGPETYPAILGVAVLSLLFRWD
jgi:hypothetical protein